ncbi:hypothetical protein TrRE_jg13221 [Triparma retinervis]|uniref:Uncharacterized protein n=1 Tax=Triparma retinervis TaxID=2557542 RepID=A0A9W7C8X6_9STRA|nr:hypothetical protein TrRE_jg13221 [Triparma retinervis]
MDDMFDILEPDHRPITSEPTLSTISPPPPAPPADDDENGDEASDASADSDFYSDEESPPKNAVEQKIVYVVEGDSDGGSSDDDLEERLLNQEKRKKQADDDAEFALHTMLTTPRLPPTPYDPPDYQPIVDKNRILRSYRKLRDAYLKECDRHTRTREDIIEHKKKIEACKKLGKERMKKQEEVRKRQDSVIKEWMALEKEFKDKEKELHQDTNELATELRQLKHDLQYEYSNLDQETRNLEKEEDKLVGKENELRFLVRDAGVVSAENAALNSTKFRLQRALKTNNEVTESGEERLEKVSEELGLVEVDVFMLQRSVKVAEEETRKWRQRYSMVEKDLKRAEKLLQDFTKSKMKELELKHGVAAGPHASLTAENIAFKNNAKKNTTKNKKSTNASMGLSQFARGFESIDTLSVDTGNSSSLMEAVFGVGKGSSTAATAQSVPRSYLPHPQFGGKTTEFAEGMPIHFHDTSHDIAVKNNRRGTAKARSMAVDPELWLEAAED